MWEPTWMGLQSKPPHYAGWIGSREVTRSVSHFQKLTVGALMWWGLIHMHIHSIWRLWNTFYEFDIDLEAHLNAFPSSTTALRCSLPLWRKPEVLEISKSLANESSSNVARTHTYTHPHHMNDVKHLMGQRGASPRLVIIIVIAVCVHL
jgi:hypothetical protein